MVQLELLDSVEEVFFKHTALFNTKQISELIKSLDECHMFARSFNANSELRNKLYTQGFMKKVPNLLKQAGNGISCSLRILFRLYAEAEVQAEERKALAEPQLVGCAPLPLPPSPPDATRARTLHILAHLAAPRRPASLTPVSVTALCARLCYDVITFYLKMARQPIVPPEVAKEVEAYNPIIVLILNQFHKLDPAEVSARLKLRFR